MERRTISRIMLALLLANPLMIMAMQEQATPGANEGQQPNEQAQPAADVQTNAQQVQQDAQDALEECTICLDDEVPAADMRTLECHHRFCAQCLTHKLEQALNGQDLLDARRNLRCPRRGCEHEMNEVDIRIATGQEPQVERFTQLMLRLQTGDPRANAPFANCPTAGCAGLYPVVQGEDAWTVMCGVCNQQYCSRCRRQHEPGEEFRLIHLCFCPQCDQQHEEGQPCPAPVQNNGQLDEAALARQEEARQNLEWVRQNTKPCPRCHVNILKTEGCNHMTCRNAGCGYEFCWECLVQWRNRGQAGYEQFSLTHHGFYNCRAPRAEAAALDALRVDAEPIQQAAGRPAQPVAGNNGDQLTPEQLAEYARQFAQLDQNNNGRNRPNPAVQANIGGGPNDQNPNDPNPHRGGPRFRAMPQRSKTPMIIGIGLVAAAVGATAYGCYKLYKYLTQPKPEIKKDVKTALADLHKIVIRNKDTAISGVYTKGSIKAFFDAQVKAGSYESLTQQKMAMLTALVNMLETTACSNLGIMEEEYNAFVGYVSDLLVQANQSESSTTAIAVPEVAVKTTPEKKPVVKKQAIRAKRTNRKVTK